MRKNCTFLILEYSKNCTFLILENSKNCTFLILEYSKNTSYLLVRNQQLQYSHITYCIYTYTHFSYTVYICYNVYTFLQSLHAGVKSIRVCLYHFRRNGHIIHVRFLPPVRESLPNSLQICVSAKPTGRPWRSLTGWFLASKINMSAKQFCTFWLGGVILYLLVY